MVYNGRNISRDSVSLRSLGWTRKSDYDIWYAMLVHYRRSRKVRPGNLDLIGVKLGCEHATGCVIRLQGVTSAVVMGYLATGATLSCVVLSTEWHLMASAIQHQNTVVALRESNILHDRTTSGIIKQTTSDYDHGMIVDVVSDSVPVDDAETPLSLDDPATFQAPLNAPSASRGDQNEMAIPKEIAAITASLSLTGSIPAKDDADDSSTLDASHPNL